LNPKRLYLLFFRIIVFTRRKPTTRRSLTVHIPGPPHFSGANFFMSDYQSYNSNPSVAYEAIPHVDVTDVTDVDHGRPVSTQLAEPKGVGYVEGVSLVVGRQIGAGIFSAPSLVNRQAGSVGMSLIIWVVAGCLAWTGSCIPPVLYRTDRLIVASYAELGCALPVNGGAYAYLHHLHGPLPGFLYAWTIVSVVKPGSFALVSLVFAGYVNRVLFLALKPNDTTPVWADKLLALICIWTVISITAMSSRLGTTVINIFTIIKVTALAIIALIGIIALGTTAFLPNSS
jgi:amino acid transporter